MTNFAVGDRVACIGPASFAEYTAFSADGYVCTIPDSISFKAAAASISQGLTAITFAEEAYKVKKGDYVLVQAAAGGVGLLLTQCCAAAGAHVIGTVSTAEKAEIAKKAGAETVINYVQTPDFVADVLAASEGKGVHVVYDGVGKSTFDASIACARCKGYVILLGEASGSVPPLALQTLTAKNLLVGKPTLFNYIAEPEKMKYYSDLLWNQIASGELDIAIYKEYPISEYTAAAADLEGRKSTGKIVLKI